MKFLADTNIVAQAAAALRAAGHDVTHMAERASDPGDLAILIEARDEGRILLSKDNDIGTLVFRDSEKHTGVIFIDDLGSAVAETELVLSVVARWAQALSAGAFVRAGRWGSRVVSALE